jgi:hypothetical protein
MKVRPIKCDFRHGSGMLNPICGKPAVKFFELGARCKRHSHFMHKDIEITEEEYVVSQVMES